VTANSTRRRKAAKPRRDFPLFRHQRGYWAKKVRGKLHYFGKVAEDPEGVKALNLWVEKKDDLLAGRVPRARTDGVTVADLVNRFLTHKETLVECGELKQRTWQDYYVVCERVVQLFGRSRVVSDLVADDFAELRASFAKTRGPFALAGDITRTKVLFKWGFDQGLLPSPIRYGQSFNKPSRKTLRLARAAHGHRMFERHEVWAMLYGTPIDGEEINRAAQPLQTMILLALNGGLGNSDVAQLPMSALDLKRGWCSFARVKTGVERRFKMWPETIASLREWLARRPKHKDDTASDLVFVTHRGGSWSKSIADNPVSKETAKLLKRLGLHRKGLSFYSLRRTHRTIASEARDEAAADAIMGHAPPSDDMAAVYRQRIDDDRLISVTNHVHNWLFPRPTIG
jgi:integrase